MASRNHTTSAVPSVTPSLDHESPREEWRPFPGFEGRYEVSDLGRVKSLVGRGGYPRISIRRSWANRDGHLFIQLHKGPGLLRSTFVHSLVLETFVGPRPDGCFACHNNGIPSDNRLSNLRWDTNGENQRDRMRHGLRHRSQKLNDSDIPVIWSRIVAGDTDAAIARDYGVTAPTIGHIRKGDGWSHITRSLPGAPEDRRPKPESTDPVYVPEPYTSREDVYWALLPGWPWYRISNFGEVQTRIDRSRKGLQVGQWRLADEWRPISLHRKRSGHMYFFALDHGHRTTVGAHRAVLLAFAGPCPTGMCCCHIDDDPSNNHASNLRWDTYRANAIDRWRSQRNKDNGTQ